MKKNCLAALFIAVLFLASCHTSSSDVTKTLEGNWLVLYPDHQLTSSRQREVYGRYQDSVVGLYGLKLISLRPDGSFLEMDSLQRPAAKWQLQDSTLRIAEGGKGFNPFKAVYRGFENGELWLTQYLLLDNEQITLEWHLKKIEADSAAARLFSTKANEWRKVPTAPETKAAMQKRLVSALNYYADYFALLANESSYFSYTRVPLPLRYYQHAIGMRSDLPDAFVKLFYNPQQAAEGYQLLSDAIAGLKGQYKWDKNLAMEYSLFLKKMAAWLG